jgi:hypothetical protein
MTKAAIHLRQAKEFCQMLRYQQNDPVIAGKLADLENILHRQTSSLTADISAISRLADSNEFCTPAEEPYFNLNQE